MRSTSMILAMMLGIFVAGCASDPTANTAAASNPDDPYENWNRGVFELNRKVDEAVLRPTAQAYVDVVPEPARNGFHNFLENLDSPVTFTNDLLQGEVGMAAETLGRFSINSTFGVGGLVDLGAPAGMPPHSSDFGQTLGVWGVGPGPYLVLPLLGPSNPRDFTGEVVDLFMDPLTYVGIRDYIYWSIGEETADLFDERVEALGTVDELERNSVDPYATARSLYLQYRDSEVHHGASDVKNLPDM